MFETHGIEQIASITELRTNASEVLRRIHEDSPLIFIQRNGEPEAVLLTVEASERLIDTNEE